jgi:hypothetical protein
MAPSIGGIGLDKSPSRALIDLLRSQTLILNCRHYALEVVQHPLRARMCGFGDKVRRELYSMSSGGFD